MTEQDLTPMKLRTRKLVDPRLQLKLVGWYALAATVSLGLQYVLTVNTMAEVVLEPHRDTAAAYDAMVAANLRILGIGLLATLPMVIAIGVASTFRVLGPLTAIRRFLGQVKEGGPVPDLRLRKGDELQDLSVLLNDVTRPLREQPEQEREAA